MVRNSNAPEGWVTTFKDLGKFIAIYDEIQDGSTGIQNKLVEAVEQMDYDYGVVIILPTFTNNMTSAVTNLTTAESNLNTAVSTYLTSVTAVDIDSSATTASGVLSDMIWAMHGATEGAAPSGILVLLSGHFHTYFLDEFGIALPVTSGSVLLSASEAMDMISGTLPSIRRQIDDTYGD